MFVNILLIMSLSESEQLLWEIAKEIIDNQTTVATWNITILVAVLLFIMAVSGLWSYHFHKREIDRAIEKAIASFKKELAAKQKEDYTKLTEKITGEFRKFKEEGEKDIKERITILDAEKARVFALTMAHGEVWENAAGWWAIAIPGYAKVKWEELLRTSVNALIDVLGKCEKLNSRNRKAVEGSLPFIPPILAEEKEQIKNRLKEFLSK